VSGIGTAFGTTGASTVVGGSVAALVCSVLGIVGGALALAKPKLAGWLMLIAAMGGTIGIFVAYFVAARCSSSEVSWPSLVLETPAERCRAASLRFS
jgi:hypothetical protein